MDIFCQAFLTNLRTKLLVSDQEASKSLVQAFKTLNSKCGQIQNKLTKQKLYTQSLIRQLNILKQQNVNLKTVSKQDQQLFQRIIQTNNLDKKVAIQKKIEQIDHLKQNIIYLLNKENKYKNKLCHFLDKNVMTINKIMKLFQNYNFQQKHKLLNQVIQLLSKNQFYPQNQIIKTLTSVGLAQNEQSAFQSSLKSNQSSQLKNKLKLNQKMRRKSVTQKKIIKKVKISQEGLKQPQNQINCSQRIQKNQSRLTLCINGQFYQETNFQQQFSQNYEIPSEYDNLYIKNSQSNERKRKNKKHLSLKIHAFNQFIKDQFLERDLNCQQLLEREQSEYVKDSQLQQNLKMNNKNGQITGQKSIYKLNKKESRQSCLLSINDNISDQNEKNLLCPKIIARKRNQQIGIIRWEYKKFIQKGQESLKTIYFRKNGQAELQDYIKQNQNGSQKQNSQVSYNSYFQPSYNQL